MTSLPESTLAETGPQNAAQAGVAYDLSRPTGYALEDIAGTLWVVPTGYAEVPLSPAEHEAAVNPTP